MIFQATKSFARSRPGAGAPAAIRMGLSLALALVALAGQPGCSSTKTRPMVSAEELQKRSVADNIETREVFAGVVGRLITRVSDRQTAGESAPQQMDILAMSGGGDFGAFGSGFLLGWGKAPTMPRPDFDAVTGVSTGALLAPFAYIGDDASIELVDSLYRNPKKDWIGGGGLLSFLPSSPSFMTIPGLQRDIRTSVGEQLITKMAAESRKGKVLIISATDLDLGRQKFWDVGAESEKAIANNDMDRVQRILFASSAIPAVFPPIEIDGGLYADGGVTANVFLRLDPRSPHAFITRWKAEHPGKPLPKVRYWVIINNQLNQTPATVQAKWPEILGPALATAIRSATIAEVRWLSSQVDYVNASMGTDIEVRVVSIPDDWRAPVKGDFKKETMESLSELGRKLGADPASWQLWASPARQSTAAPAQLPALQASTGTAAPQ